MEIWKYSLEKSFFSIRRNVFLFYKKIKILKLLINNINKLELEITKMTNEKQINSTSTFSLIFNGNIY